MSVLCVLGRASIALRAARIYPENFANSHHLRDLAHVCPLRHYRAWTSGHFWPPWKPIDRPANQQHRYRSVSMASSGPRVSSVTRVAVGQMTSVGDQEANFAICQRLALNAKEAGCCMLFLPECCSFIGQNQQEVSLSKPSDDARLHMQEPHWCDGSSQSGSET